MAYEKNGYPIEQASKIGHLKLTNNAVITQIISQFEEPIINYEDYPNATGKADLSIGNLLERVITIDGGQATVPNEYRPEKQLSFIQVAACMLKLSDLEYLRTHPMVDPRDLGKYISEPWYHPMVLPHAGVRLPWKTVKETMRSLIDAGLQQTGLYETLKFLVYREWEDEYSIPESEQPHMNCWSCGTEFILRRHALSYSCPACGHDHRLSDYLQIGADSSEDWTKEETASSVRNVLETLTLFHFLRIYQGTPALSNTLFIKDGPFLLRAQLSRLVQPIRDFISHLYYSGNKIFIVGIEKSGEVADYAAAYNKGDKLREEGDYLLPSIKFLVEEISGGNVTKEYRNRVSYGVKMIYKSGPDHVLVLNLPVVNYPKDSKNHNLAQSPVIDDLIGFHDIAKTLSQLLSYQYPNALLPIVLANSTVSIARKPSGGILHAFTSHYMGGV